MAAVALCCRRCAAAASVLPCPCTRNPSRSGDRSDTGGGSTITSAPKEVEGTRRLFLFILHCRCFVVAHCRKSLPPKDQQPRVEPALHVQQMRRARPAVDGCQLRPSESSGAVRVPHPSIVQQLGGVLAAGTAPCRLQTAGMGWARHGGTVRHSSLGWRRLGAWAHSPGTQPRPGHTVPAWAHTPGLGTRCRPGHTPQDWAHGAGLGTQCRPGHTMPAQANTPDVPGPQRPLAAPQSSSASASHAQSCGRAAAASVRVVAAAASVRVMAATASVRVVAATASVRVVAATAPHQSESWQPPHQSESWQPPHQSESCDREVGASVRRQGIR